MDSVENVEIATTTNEFKRNVTNIKFEAELEEILRNDDQYQTKGTLERFL